VLNSGSIISTGGAVSLGSNASSTITGTTITAFTNISLTGNTGSNLAITNAGFSAGTSFSASASLGLAITSSSITAVTSGSISSSSAYSITGSTLTIGTVLSFSGQNLALSNNQLAFGTSIQFNVSGTTYSGSFNRFDNTGQWTVVISGGTSYSGATVFTFVGNARTINSNMFPSGINTNCIWIIAPTGSFAVTLPHQIFYRNYVQSSPVALTVTSTTGESVAHCDTGYATSTIIRDPLAISSSTLLGGYVYLTGPIVFYVKFTNPTFPSFAPASGQNLPPFGSVTTGDFTVTNGVITSLQTYLVGPFPARKRDVASVDASGSVVEYQVTVNPTCDGQVKLTYTGSVNGFPFLVAPSSLTVIYAGCLAQQTCLLST